MTRISRKVREEAALICAIAASTECGGRPVFLSASGVAIDASLEAMSVAYKAAAVTDRLVYKHGNFHEVDAEAESLLRTGWCPGDEP